MAQKSIHYRAIFISDVHLGTPECQASLLLEFLRSTSCDALYLVGDIIDLQKMQHSLSWTPDMTRVLATVLDKARQGTRVIYIPGNHDEQLRECCGRRIEGVEVALQHVHVMEDGRRILVMHGDAFDNVIRTFKRLERFGDALYDFILFLNRYHSSVRRVLGYSYWSFASFVKHRFKEAVRYIRRFEIAAIDHAAARHYDGIICGHIHHPNEIRQEGALYLNSGDWVEHCTAIVEDSQGHLSLLNWPARRHDHVPLEQTPRAA